MTRRRGGGIKRGESSLASNQFPICSPQSGTLREVHRVTQRREKGRKETEVARRIKGGIKRREIQPVISSLSVLHSPEHPERFTELSREEKGEGGDRGDLGKKRECRKGREQSSQ